MRRLADFSSKTRNLLAERAGYKCSVCQKSTIGAAAGPSLVFKDGIAAHINAAQKGARYNASLTVEYLQSEENGIWACRLCANEIDSVSSIFSIGALRGLKDQRNRIADREVHRGLVSEKDVSIHLIDFPYFKTEEKVIDALYQQPYNYQTASLLHDLVVTDQKASRVLDLVPVVIVSVWESRPDVAGILATLLCNTINLWHPTTQILDKLSDLCDSALESDDWLKVASVEPLAFAIAAQGKMEVHKVILDRIVSSTPWRKEDVARVKKYYGSTGTELGAILRHWHDPLRKGILRANDVGRLMDLLISNAICINPESPLGLLDLLLDHAKVLSDNGAESAANSVTDFVEALRIQGKILG
jgi:hypothetical protein